MTIGKAYRQLSLLLQLVYDPREAGNIASLVVEHITGHRGSSRILHKQDSLAPEQQLFFKEASAGLLAGKPVQYVLHEAYFFNMKLYVNEDVLIPRPETEELVDWVLNDIKSQGANVSLLDVGTGSGCIAIAIKKALLQVKIFAVDISEKALLVAQQNAAQQQTDIHFLQADILNEADWKALPKVDYIISNPPYVTQSEATFINENVLNHEPHLALFVPDNNPLLFYDAISTFALKYLNNKGKLFLEINELFGNEVIELLSRKGYQNIELKKDLQSKDRMIKAEVAPPSPEGELEKRRKLFLL